MPHLFTIIRYCFVFGYCLCFLGCDFTGKNVGVSSGSSSWSSTEVKIPGIDEASISYGACIYGTGEKAILFIIWSDTERASSHGSTTKKGVRYEGFHISSDGQRVEWHCETADGKTGIITLNGAEYDLADGLLFLVSTQDSQIQVRQLKRDTLKNLQNPDIEKFKSLAKNDSEIWEFFAKAAEGKGP